MLEWIISSTALTLIVILLRAVLKGKMSLRLQYALWALVLVRLLVPLSFGSTELSVQNVIDRPAVEAPQTAYPAESRTPISANNNESPAYNPQDPYAEDQNVGQSLPVTVPQTQPAQSTATIPPAEIAAEAPAAAEPLTVNEILNIVWASGAGLVALWLLLTNLQFYRKLRRSRKPLEVEHAPLPVFVTDKIDTPCLFGLIRPKIYVTPEVAEDETALRYSIEHEATHRRHGDHLWSLLRGACLAVHWYNPLVWVAAILSRSDAELACDEATIKRIGEEHRAEYGRTLIQLTCEKRPALFVAATTMTGSGRGIKGRIKLIVKKPKTAVITLIAIVLVIAIAVGCTFTGAKTEDKTADGLTTSDLPALLDAIDLRETTVTYHGTEDVSYPADTAIRAELYLELLQRFPWDICETVTADPAERDGAYVRIASPQTTFTFYENEQENGGCLHVETDGAAVWLRYPTDLEEIYEIRQDESHRFVGTYSVYYGEMLRWFVDARGAALHGGDGRLLTAEELDFFEDYTAAWPVTWHGTIRNEFEGEYAPEIKWWNNTEVSCFFTASYSDVRDINAEEFLRAFPYDGTYEPFSVEQEESPMPLGLRRIPRSSVNEVLMKYAGVTVEEMNMNWFETVTYDAATDCFCPEDSFAGTPMYFQAQTGVENGSVVTLWDWGDVSLHPYAELRLEKYGDGWRILSFTREGEIGTTPARDRLAASEIPAILDAIDLQEATLSFQAATFPADGAIHAADYLKSLKTQFSWKDDWENRPASSNELGSFIQLVTPHATLTFYCSNGTVLHIETENAEGWFLSQVMKFDEDDRSTSAYKKALSWYVEAEAASLYGGNARILSEEETESFRTAFPSAFEADGNTLLSREIRCFFTSHYTNVRDIDAYAFLKYFPEDPNAPEVDEAEWALVQEVEDWRFGEDNHLVTLDWLPVPVHRISRSRVNEVLMQYAGITVEEMNTSWFDEVTYVPATDCFYIFTSDAGSGSFLPWLGIEYRNGDAVTLWETPCWSSALPVRLDLIRNGDGWRIVSFGIDGYEPAETKEKMIDGNRAYLVDQLERYGSGSDNVQYDVLYDKSGKRAYLFAVSDRGYVICKYSSLRCIDHGEGNPFEEYMSCKKVFEGVSHYRVILPDDSSVIIVNDQ